LESVGIAHDGWNPLGTLHYMSPEQARDDEGIDERTDVYGCAAVLYEMLSGQGPHVAQSPHALLYKIIHEVPRRLEEHGPWLPVGLAEVVHRGLEKNRAGRRGRQRRSALVRELSERPRNEGQRYHRGDTQERRSAGESRSARGFASSAGRTGGARLPPSGRTSAK
jgi:serine/threonine protein kinase